MELFVSGSVVVENHSIMGVLEGAKGKLWVVSGARTEAGDVLRIENSAVSSLALYAPEVDVSLGNNVQLTGGVTARNLHLVNRSVLSASTDPRAPLVIGCE